MKKALIGIVALALITLSITSCKKATAVNGGSWAFKGQTYTVTSGIADITQNPTTFMRTGLPDTTYPIDLSLATACSASNSYGSVVFTFYTWPNVSGTYTITPNQFPDSGSHEIAINMILAKGDSFAQNNYNPSAYGAGLATANVTVMSNGYIKIVIPSLEMVNYNNASDSGLLTTSVMQTQPAE